MPIILRIEDDDKSMEIHPISSNIIPIVFDVIGKGSDVMEISVDDANNMIYYLQKILSHERNYR